MKGYKTLFSCMGILIVFSCANNDKWNGLNSITVTGQAHADRTETVSTYGDTTTTPPYAITVNMEFIDTSSVANQDVSRKINKLLIEEFLKQKEENNVQNAVDTYINRLQKEYENDDLSPEIYNHYKGKMEYGKEGVINYIHDEIFYGGGAHPSQNRTILRFDTSTGTEIELYDFFADTCTQALCDKLTQRLMKMHGVETLDSLQALGYLDMQDMFVTENFALLKDSVSFYYNQYDIAPYAYGPSTITFSYEELKEFIRKDP